MRTLLILRTHRADPETLAAFDRYSALGSVDVIIGCDERAGAVDTGPRPKVGFDTSVLKSLNLFPHPTCGWRCGDYFYYVARLARPSYDFYWLLEPDVVIHTADLNETFDALNTTAADLLAPHFGPRDNRWGWYRTMRDKSAHIYGCIFPMTRLSARAIDHLFAARRSAAVPETPAALQNWPNDEVFVATELHHSGFTCRELSHNFLHCYTRETLRTGTPWDITALAAAPPDGRIYHPVRRFAPWFEEQSGWAASYAVSRRGKKQPHFRANHIRLARLAAASLSVEAVRHAALFLLLLASRMTLEARYEPTPGQPDFYIEEEISPHRVMRTLHSWFSPRGNRRVFAKAHLLEPADMVSADIASQTDFHRDDPEPLGEPPWAFALPYAYDLTDASLMFTVHPLPSAILSANSMFDEQRAQACVAYRMEFRYLHHFYPLPTEFPGISFLIINEVAARADAVQRLRSTGLRAVSDPPALMQIASQSGRFLRLRRRWWRPLLWSAIAPIFVTYGATREPVVLVVSDNILSIRRLLRALLTDVEFWYDVDKAASAARAKNASALASAAAQVTLDCDRN